MDYYDIISLIVYWVDQEKEDFKALRSIVKIIRDQDIQEEEKGDIIFSILRESGLREVSFGSLDDELIESEYQDDVSQEEITPIPPSFKTEMMFIDIMNTKIQILIHLN